MVRAGLIRQIGSGLWSWLPAGWRVHQRIVGIVRAEMNAIGGQEMLMPVLHPAEPWRRSGRYPIDELFKLNDRRGADMVLAMTHEEIVTGHVAAAVRSYRDLPMVLYHFQVKERDEPRPRAGVLRTREFIMKDSYTFDRDQAGLEERYAMHVGAYDRIMERTGLRYYRVESDVGMMGGLGAHEYMAPCAAGGQFADEHGISWPRAIAPFEVHLVAIGAPGTRERDAAEGVYRALREAGVSVVFDDRDAGPGEKFADAELLGSPLRLTVGRRALEEGSIEVQIRRGRAEAPAVLLSDDPAVLLEGLDATWPSVP